MFDLYVALQILAFYRPVGKLTRKRFRHLVPHVQELREALRQLQGNRDTFTRYLSYPCNLACRTKVLEIGKTVRGWTITYGVFIHIRSRNGCISYRGSGITYCGTDHTTQLCYKVLDNGDLVEMVHRIM